MSPKKIILPLQVGISGSWKAIVHDGDGIPKQETAWTKNLITSGGLNSCFTENALGYAVAGDGNTTPTLGDVTLDSYKGKMTSNLGCTGSVNNDPGAGDLWIQSEIRVQFVPGAFGVSSVNIAEAGFTYTEVELSTVDASSPLFNRGLLVDTGGSPTTVAVLPSEYLDLFWRCRVNLPFDSVGTINIDIDGVPTPHDYVVRPAALIPTTGASVLPWGYANVDSSGANSQSTRFFPNGFFGGSTANSTNATNIDPLPPSSAIPSQPISSQSNNRINAAYIPGSFERSAEFIWTLSRGNVPAPGVKTVFVQLGWTYWQVTFDPPIQKVDLKQLNLTFKLSAVNTP